MRRAPLCALLIVCTAAAIAAQIPTPKPPRLPNTVPGLEQILREERPLTTAFTDARPEIALLDRREPPFQPMAPHLQADGTFRLPPGAWQLEAQSFCLGIGAYGPRPTAGDGYLTAPIKGGRGEIIRHVLASASRQPDIEQGDIQWLLWGILARAKIGQMKPSVQDAARRLLTPQQIRTVDGGALGAMPPGATRALYNKLPPEARRALEAESRMREAVYQTNADYRRLERIAVLTGEAPRDPTRRPVPPTRWSFHPNGFFIRYLPHLYSRTTIHVIVPQPYTIERDALRRITVIDDRRGYRIETEYDDTTAPLQVPGDARLRGYAFRSIRITRPAAGLGGSRVKEWRNRGWTFVTVKHARRAPDAARPRLLPAAYRPQPSRFERWGERYQWYQDEVQDRYDFYRERWDRAERPPSEDAVGELEDHEHYEEGLDAALGGDESDRLEWLIDHQERERAALEYAISVLEGLPGSSEAGDGSRGFDPSGDVGLPAGGAGRQTIGMSGRGR